MLMMEFNEQDSGILDEIIEVVKRYPDIERLQVKEGAVLSVLGLEVYPNRRKRYAELEAISREKEVTGGLLQRRGDENATRKLDQHDYRKKYDGYVSYS